ncbi:MAG: CDP-alcohol phosphatidyltransferase family protein [Arenicellales bacterium]|nr:CDP-alcohol phosphatidyltransferase family protein [Arenicellales bacterium]
MVELKAVWRTPEIEEYSNLYLVHPVSHLLANLFARWGWSPHSVSGLGMLSAFIAAGCYYQYQITVMPFLGLLFMVGWHVFDGADGQLARLTGQTSEIGKLVDGLCDHIGFGMVYIALALSQQEIYGYWVWLLAVVAGISHVVQASALEFHRDSYDCWVHQRFSKCVPCLDDFKRKTQSSKGVLRPLNTFHSWYLQLQYRFAGADHSLLSNEQRLRAQPQRGKLGENYKLIALDSVRQWTLLSANKRTVAVTLFCIVKFPILFFLYEIVILNIVLWWLRHKQHSVNSELRRSMDRTTG